MSNPEANPRKHAENYLDLTGEDRVRELISQFATTIDQKDDPASSSNLFLTGQQLTTVFLYQEWTKSFFPYLTVHSVSPDGPHPSVTFSFTVQPQHCNRLNNLRRFLLLLTLSQPSSGTHPSSTLFLK